MTKFKLPEVMEFEDTSVCICRLCAEMTSSKSFIPLYTEDKQEQAVTKKLNQLMVNLISPNDGLPQEVCLQCVENVSRYYTFVTNIIETQNKLRRIMQLPEIRRLNNVNDNQNQFIENIVLENVTDVGHGSLTNKDSILRMRECSLTYKSKENAFKTNGRKRISPNNESGKPTSIENRSKIEILSERTVQKLCTMSNEKSHGTSRSIMGERSKQNYLRIYRCGLCYEKFKIKEECLRHIVDVHPEIKKPVSKNTIFEMVCNTSDDEKRFLNEASLSFFPSMQCQPDTLNRQSNSSFTNFRNEPSRKATVIPEAADKITVNRLKSLNKNNMNEAHNVDISENKQKNSTTSETSFKNVPKKSGGIRRKVLCIDSFYKEVRMPCIRYICDVCGRTMVSQFAFRRHLHEHDPSDDELSEDTTAQMAKPSMFSRPHPAYCRMCKRRVSHWERHTMFHAISKLERKYPDIVKLFSS